MNYRIVIASSGYYYVQNHRPYHGWKKIGGFFNSRRGAEKFIGDMRRGCCAPHKNLCVVGYY